MLLNDRTRIDKFDIAGVFDFSDQLQPQDEFRTIALDTRPDLKAALEAVDKAQTDHKLATANGSTDPTLTAHGTRTIPSPITRLASTHLGSALDSHYVFSTATRERSCAPSWTSAATRILLRRRARRYSAMLIQPTRW